MAEQRSSKPSVKGSSPFSPVINNYILFYIKDEVV